MAFGGLSSQFMMKAESTIGTAVTVDTAYEILPATDSALDLTVLEGVGVQSGVLAQRDSRVTTSTFSASGTVEMEVPDQGHFGLLLKHAMGSSITVPVVIATTAFKQIHTIGSKDALGLTMQYGMPRLVDGVGVALTYNGCKISDLEFSCSIGQMLQAKATWDGWNEAVATALATPSYTAGAGVFPFKDASLFTLGGTAATSAGLTTITSGVAAATLVKGFTMQISTGLANQRFGLGSSGIKQNQVQNAYVMVTGTMDAEFTNRTELYDLYRSQTSTPMQLDFFHGDAGSSNPYRVSFIIPAFRVTKADISGYGSPDIGTQKIEYKALIDSSGTNPQLQIVLVSKDTTL